MLHCRSNDRTAVNLFRHDKFVPNISTQIYCIIGQKYLYKIDVDVLAI